MNTIQSPEPTNTNESKNRGGAITGNRWKPLKISVFATNFSKLLNRDKAVIQTTKREVQDCVKIQIK